MAALEETLGKAIRAKGAELRDQRMRGDHFKRVNDQHGHAAGDAVLRRFTAIVHATMRDTDIFGRYGGEEFMLLLPATAPEAALGALERIHAALRGADLALYQAKGDGRNCTRMA